MHVVLLSFFFLKLVSATQRFLSAIDHHFTCLLSQKNRLFFPGFPLLSSIFCLSHVLIFDCCTCRDFVQLIYPLIAFLFVLVCVISKDNLEACSCWLFVQTIKRRFCWTASVTTDITNVWWTWTSSEVCVPYSCLFHVTHFNFIWNYKETWLLLALWHGLSPALPHASDWWMTFFKLKPYKCLFTSVLIYLIISCPLEVCCFLKNVNYHLCS